MKLKILILVILSSPYIHAQAYKKIHSKAVLVDTHNDILMKAVDNGMVFDQDLRGKTHSDLARWKQGGLDVQLFSVFCDGDKKNPYQYANRQMDTLDAVAARNPDKIMKAYNMNEIMTIVKQHKIAALFGVEGGHMIEDDIDKLDSLFKRGTRYMTLTWNNSTSWATSAADETSGQNLIHPGLTELGKNIVHRMNKLGMIVDISHVGQQTFWDVIQTTSKPIMASHSSVYQLCPHRRNLKDDQIKAIAKNGGVIQINFNPGFIDSTYGNKENSFFQKHAVEKDSLKKMGVDDWHVEEYLYSAYKNEIDMARPALSILITHIDYIRKLVGVDYIGLGSDFDGITVTPMQLEDVTTYPLITKALLDKGYTEKDITKILGGNFLRVLKANELPQ
ncbi:MAG: dipeptidase [Saprospiraceae bacterium]